MPRKKNIANKVEQHEPAELNKLLERLTEVWFQSFKNFENTSLSGKLKEIAYFLLAKVCRNLLTER